MNTTTIINKIGSQLKSFDKEDASTLGLVIKGAVTYSAIKFGAAIAKATDSKATGILVGASMAKVAFDGVDKFTGDLAKAAENIRQAESANASDGLHAEVTDDGIRFPGVFQRPDKVAEEIEAAAQQDEGGTVDGEPV